jgi:hypothetical protein
VRTGHTSMTVPVEAWRRHLPSDEVRKVTQAILCGYWRRPSARCRAASRQRRILVLDVADPLVDGPNHHVLSRVGRAAPSALPGLPPYRREAGQCSGARMTGMRCAVRQAAGSESRNDRKAAHPLSGWRSPFPGGRRAQSAASSAVPPHGLSPAELFPFIETVEGDEAAPAGEAS